MCRVDYDVGVGDVAGVAVVVDLDGMAGSVEAVAVLGVVVDVVAVVDGGDGVVVGGLLLTPVLLAWLLMCLN